MLRPRQPFRAKSTPVTRLEIVGSLQVPESPVRYAAKPPLLDWPHLAPWQQDNQYILTSYRVPSYSYRGCIQSLFYLHNESLNIHSHMFGTFVFSCIFLCLYAFSDLPFDRADVLVFAAFALGAVSCLSASAAFHTLLSHSPSICCFANQLDYVGIVALITGSFVPSMYYGFFCEPLLQKTYLGMASAFCIDACKYTDYAFPDIVNWGWLHNCLDQLAISYFGMETISCMHVRCDGSIGCAAGNTRDHTFRH